MLGCHIGFAYVGALAYADNLVLLAPNAMQCNAMHAQDL
jgi:hypothetical protein